MQPVQSEQPVQREQPKHSVQPEQREQPEQSVQPVQFLRLSSEARAAASVPHVSSEARLPLVPLIHFIAFSFFAAVANSTTDESYHWKIGVSSKNN
jgi:hypothetical protein